MVPGHRLMSLAADLTAGRRRFVQLLGAAVLLGVATMAAYGMFAKVGESSALFDAAVFPAVLLAAAALCLARAAFVREDRGAWLALGVGLCSYGLGIVIWAVELRHMDPVPFPVGGRRPLARALPGQLSRDRAAGA